MLRAVASREAAEGDYAVDPIDMHDFGRRHVARCPLDRVHFGTHALGRVQPEIALDNALAVDPGFAARRAAPGSPHPYGEWIDEADPAGH